MLLPWVFMFIPMVTKLMFLELGLEDIGWVRGPLVMVVLLPPLATKVIWCVIHSFLRIIPFGKSNGRFIGKGSWEVNGGEISQTKVLDLLTLSGSTSIMGRGVIVHDIADPCDSVCYSMNKICKRGVATYVGLDMITD